MDSDQEFLEEGGYIVPIEWIPEIIREADKIANYLIAVIAFSEYLTKEQPE